MADLMPRESDHDIARARKKRVIATIDCLARLRFDAHEIAELVQWGSSADDVMRLYDERRENGEAVSPPRYGGDHTIFDEGTERLVCFYVRTLKMPLIQVLEWLMRDEVLLPALEIYAARRVRGLLRALGERQAPAAYIAAERAKGRVIFSTEAERGLWRLYRSLGREPERVARCMCRCFWDVVQLAPWQTAPFVDGAGYLAMHFLRHHPDLARY